MRVISARTKHLALRIDLDYPIVHEQKCVVGAPESRSDIKVVVASWDFAACDTFYVGVDATSAVEMAINQRLVVGLKRRN